ncbi:hypothetical protein SKAU_G00101460 [Synaphobranchus kaupii]|uniref:Butyrophilin subfamily 1 member A1-like n=1 Tax=Synaphobranchus kaupii TaxID=118154 RepID=A0A9Q1FYH7_SYNKA|nr:hypothetical protein SKAU_G00101460 [Synaphobranchus kaupii]
MRNVRLFSLLGTLVTHGKEEQVDRGKNKFKTDFFLLNLFLPLTDSLRSALMRRARNNEDCIVCGVCGLLIFPTRYPAAVQFDGERASGRVELKLGCLGSRPQLLVDSLRSGRTLSLSCLSRGWYPAPIVSWSSSDGQTLTGMSLDTEDQGHSILQEVRNGVTLTAQDGLKVTCTMLNPVLQSQSEEVLTITGDFPPDVSPWLLAFWGVFPLVAMAAGIVGYFFKRKRDSIKEKQRQAGEAVCEPLMKQDEYAELKKELSGARAVNNSEWKRVQSRRTKNFSLTPGSVGPELSSGSHYWEVTLRDISKWKVGVKGKEAVLGRDSFPETGVWSLSCSPDKGYRAWLHPPFPITPSSQPERLGILLDYNEGQLTLYDPGTKPVQRLYTFNAVFTSPVLPFYE